MDNWHPSVVYDMATARHREDIGRGEASRWSVHPDQRAARATLAAALVGLAARLDPALRQGERPARTIATA